jgi:hypothetical protein
VLDMHLVLPKVCRFSFGCKNYLKVPFSDEFGRFRVRFILEEDT